MALPDDVKELAARVRNWGRWGDDDEIGTINLITDDVVKAAAAEITTGRRFSLDIPLDEHGPQTGAVPGRENPKHEMFMVDVPLTGDPSNFTTSDDRLVTGLQSCTHWDGLAHVSYERKLYNGVPSSVITDAGAARLGIEHVSTLVGRGVLLDVARAHGVEELEGAHAITGEDLDAAAELGKVKIRSGDIALVRTGRMRQFLAGGKDPYNAIPAAGPSLQSVEWFHDHNIAAVATDNLIFEVYPSEREDAMLAVHMIHLVDMGMTQGQNFNLEELAQDCAADGRYTFFLDASPLPVTGGCGSPVNPVAVK
jgi:kynurenine formamidase